MMSQTEILEAINENLRQEITTPQPCGSASDPYDAYANRAGLEEVRLGMSEGKTAAVSPFRFGHCEDGLILTRPRPRKPGVAEFRDWYRVKLEPKRE